MNSDITNDVTWFVADWQMFLTSIEYGRMALVIDLSRNHVLHVRFRVEETLDPSWIFTAFDRLSERFGMPDALVTGQESLYPTLIIAGSRFASPVTAELNPRISHSPEIQAYTKSLIRKHLQISGRYKGALAVNRALESWKLQINADGICVPQYAFTRGYYFSE